MKFLVPVLDTKIMELLNILGRLRVRGYLNKSKTNFTSFRVPKAKLLPNLPAWSVLPAQVMAITDERSTTLLEDTIHLEGEQQALATTQRRENLSKSE